MKRICSSILLIIGLVATLSAQNPKPIALSELLAKVQKSNANIKISEFELAVAKADYAVGNAIFLPNISVSHTGMATTNPLMAFGSKLNQEILTQADFNPQFLNDPNQIQNYSTRITAEQPLVNIDGIYQRKAAKSTMHARKLQVERTKDYLAFEASKAYMQLQLAYKTVEVLKKALKATRANEAMVVDRYEQGLLQKADLLQAMVRANEVENQLLSAQSAIGNASDYLSFLMHEDNTGHYVPINQLALVQDSLGLGANDIKDRADVRAMQLVSEAYQANYKANKMTFLPRLNAFGSYELYDDDIFRADAKGYTFGASLSWDVFQGSKRFAKVKKSRASYEKALVEYESYRSKSAMELQKARRMLLDAKNRVNTSAQALQQSEEALQIRGNRFEEGLESTTDLLRAEAQHAQKELEYYQTIFEYNYALAYHNFLTKK